MKILPALLCAMVCTATSCVHNHPNIHLTYTDSDHYYSMNADFNEKKTRDLEEFMNKKIGAAGNISFTNIQSDATVTLNDHTTCYMRKFPGHIEIKLDKDENSEEAYQRIKSMCEGFKKILTK